MHTATRHIAEYLKSRSAGEADDIDWAKLASEMPWYPVIHLIRAVENPDDHQLARMAGLYLENPLYLQWLFHFAEDQTSTAHIEATEAIAPQHLPEETKESSLEEVGLDPEPVEAKEICTEKNIVADPTPAIEISSSAPTTPEPEVEQPEEIPDFKRESNTSHEAPLVLPATTGLSKIREEPLHPEEELKLEPYHTIDYFASQGIRVNTEMSGKEEATPLDKQVKSFTEWLKTMKKLSYQPDTNYYDPLVESKAKASLLRQGVLTEAMAEVWIKQGNLDKAVEVYEKLILLHPEKKLFFAARLQEIKEQQ